MDWWDRVRDGGVREWYNTFIGVISWTERELRLEPLLIVHAKDRIGKHFLLDNRNGCHFLVGF